MTAPANVTTDTELRCALTGRVLSPDEAYWAPPLVTFRELISAIASTALRAPSQLRYVLLAEQPDVAYAPEARELLARRRNAEQIKFLLSVLLSLLIIVGLIYLLA
jgi:hypothetical protein